MMAVNRAIQPNRAQGNPVEIFRLTTLPQPKASPKNVVVRVVLRPVNPTDLLPIRIGAWEKLDLREVVIGSEGIGVVEEVGEGVTKVKIGQRVIPLIHHRYYPFGYGLWRDYVEVPEIDVVPVPANISDAVAAQFYINPWAAYGLLKRLQIPKGGYLLQTAAGSAVGKHIISLANYYGIKTINVVRRNDGIQTLKDIGADYVINSSTEVPRQYHPPKYIMANEYLQNKIGGLSVFMISPMNNSIKLRNKFHADERTECEMADVKARVMEITEGKGAYGAVDPVATESTRLVAACLRDGGQLLMYGALSGDDIRVNIQDLMRQVPINFFRVSTFSHDLPQREETVSAIFDLLSKKIIDPGIGKTYPLEEFKDAIKESEREARGGKVFLSSY